LYNRYELLRNLPEYGQHLAANAIVMARHGDEFLITATLGVPSQKDLPRAKEDWKIYWLLKGVEPDELTPSMIVVGKGEAGFFMVIVENGPLMQQLESITDTKLEGLLQRNPHLKGAIKHNSEN